MDAKGRVLIHPGMREQGSEPDSEQNALHLTLHHERPCLVLRTQAVWGDCRQIIQDGEAGAMSAAELNGAELNSAELGTLRRRVLGHDQLVRPDTNFRIPVTPLQRQMAKLFLPKDMARDMAQGEDEAPDTAAPPAKPPQVVVAGVGSCVEIWSYTLWAAHCAVRAEGRSAAFPSLSHITSFL